MAASPTVSDPRLVCTRCGATAAVGIDGWCDCGGAYETAYDWDGLAAGQLDGDGWLAALLPAGGGAAVALGQGATPLVEAAGALLKCEHLNPTGSYKDRIAAVGVAIGVAAGSASWLGTSSGNAGAAFAAYGARAGLSGRVYVSGDIPDQKRAQIELFGAVVERVQGLGEDAAAETALFRSVAARARRERSVLAITARSYNAAAMDGVKPIAYELVAELGEPPANVIVPTGGGGLVASIWRGFEDLRRIGRIGSVPRMIVAQPSGCAPIHAAVCSGADEVAPATSCTSVVSGLQLLAPPDGRQAVESVRASGGFSVAVDDADAIAAQAALARDHGVLVEPAAALGFAAYRQAAPSGSTVVILTGSGLKTPLPVQPASPPIAVDALRS